MKYTRYKRILYDFTYMHYYAVKLIETEGGEVVTRRWRRGMASFV